MTYFYVHAPFSGKCTSKIATREYCTGGQHKTMGGAGYDYPMDIGFLYEPSSLDFVGSSNILSIRTHPVYGRACADYAPAGLNDFMEISMYTGVAGTGTLVAKIIYGHIIPTRGDDTYNCYASNGKRVVQNLGMQPADPGGYPNCYNGVHTHFEATNINGYNASLGACNEPQTTYGDPFLYEFSPDGPRSSRVWARVSDAEPHPGASAATRPGAKRQGGGSRYFHPLGSLASCAGLFELSNRTPVTPLAATSRVLPAPAFVTNTT